MADKKISALTAASTPLAGTEVLPIVQSGSTVKVAVSDLTLGRNVSLLGLTATGTTQKLGAVTLADITVQIGPDTPATTSSGRILFNTSSTEKNWFINHNWNLAGGLSFAQSTAAGGSTMGSDSHQWDSSGNYKVVNGNVVIGTAGKGIDFSANDYIIHSLCLLHPYWSASNLDHLGNYHGCRNWRGFTHNYASVHS
jgi:hypothetical protein